MTWVELAAAGLRRLGTLLVLLFSAPLFCACSSCSSTAIAELVEQSGEVVRDRDAERERWQNASVGASFDFGDAVRTMAAASATVEFDDGARVLLEPNTTIRFLRFAPESKQRGIDVVSGEAVLEARQEQLQLFTSVGLASLQPGSRVTLSRGKQGLRVMVEVGLARLEAEGKTIEVSQGRGVEVGLGMAIVDRFGDVPPEQVPAQPALEPAASAAPLGSFPIVARTQGSGVTLRTPGAKTALPLGSGEHTLEPGSELALGPTDSATVSRGDVSATLAGPGKYIVVGDGSRVVEPVSGSMTLRADGNDVSVEIPGGKVTALGSRGPAIGLISRGKAGAVNVSGRRGVLRVELGDTPVELAPGETARVQGGKLTLHGRGPAYHDLALPAGASLLVHDPAPPSIVGISSPCEHLTVVETSTGKSAVGKGTVNLRFEAGRHGYDVRCLKDNGELGPAEQRGSVTIYKDAGTRALAQSPPATQVNTDGRTYTVLYQNLLPSIHVRWPNAPSAPSFSLIVASPNGTKTLSSKTASYTFRSGALAEGKHTFRFSSSLGRSSRSSSAVIRFDNAAPKGSITSPAEGGFGAGSSVVVSGIALPGWSVFAGSSEVKMDSEQRFSQSVSAGPRGLVLRFSHPSRGVHHYLRRAAGVPR